MFYKDYFISFYRALEAGAQKKIDYVLGMLKIQERVNERFVKFIRDGVYEIRASHNGNIYRAFFIFDEGNIVMLLNGYQKKTQKAPESEINMALKLKRSIMQTKVTLAASMPYLMRNTERSVHPNVMLSIVRLTLIVLVRLFLMQGNRSE